MPKAHASRAVAVVLMAGWLVSCQGLERFDTSGGSAFCGGVVASKFVLTPTVAGGFDRGIQLRLKLDMTHLTTIPGSISTDDGGDAGPCAGLPTFDDAKLVVTQEVANDPLSAMTFADGQVHNIVAWVDSTCRGKMLAVVSLYKTNHVEVRLLKPGTKTTERDAFALFALDRRDKGCGF